MSDRMRDLLENLWASAELKEDAENAITQLGPALRKQLFDVIDTLHKNASARAQLRDGETAILPKADRQLTDKELSGHLELLVLSMFHSDTLAYLPSAQRERRLENWAVRTEVDPCLVREAVALGPNGLSAIIDRAA